MTSITHRVPGILLAIGIAFGVYLLDRGLRNPQPYAWVTELFAHAAAWNVLPQDQATAIFGNG